MKFGVRKLEPWGYHMVKKSSFWHGRTDRRTRCDRYYPR